MLFVKAIAFFFFATLASAAPGGSPTISQCNTGPPSCCKTVGAANSLPGVGLITGLLGIVIQDLNTVVGLGCTPITVIGVGQGANCAQQPVCCQNNNFNGVINIACDPISA